MQVHAESTDHEIRLTVEAAMEIANSLAEAATPTELRAVLVAHDFMRAAAADDREVTEAHRSLSWLAGLLQELPESELTQAVASVNRALASRAIAPSLSTHDGYPLHIHWTDDDTALGERVCIDVLMALAQTLAKHGATRFGRCQADDCDRVFFDATKNNSRRFCSDARCASRTHTANHRARKRT